MAEVQHATLVASTVTTQTFTPSERNVEVTNVDGASAIYFTVDGSTPTVAGANCQVIPAAIQSLSVPREGTGTVTVKLISSGTPKVSVRIHS